MHMPMTRSAVDRGMQWAAGMLTGKLPVIPAPRHPPVEPFALVSWHTETRSRRVDEAARRARLRALG